MATLEDARLPSLRDKVLAQSEATSKGESFLERVGKKLTAKKKK